MGKESRKRKMTPKPKSKKAKNTEPKRKKLAAPPELKIDIVHETFDDSMDDIIAMEPTADDHAALDDVSDDDSLKPNSRRNNDKASNEAENPLQGAAALNSDDDNENAFDDQPVAPSHTARLPNVKSVAISMSSSTATKGAIPKQPKPANQLAMDYEFPKEKPSWYDETERSNYDDSVNERRNPFARTSKQSARMDLTTNASQKEQHWQPTATIATNQTERPADSMTTHQR